MERFIFNFSEEIVNVALWEMWDLDRNRYSSLYRLDDIFSANGFSKTRLGFGGLNTL